MSQSLIGEHEVRFHPAGMASGIIIGVAILCLLGVGSIAWDDYVEQKDLESIRAGTTRNHVENRLGLGIAVSQKEVPTLSQMGPNGVDATVASVKGSTIVKYRTRNCIVFVSYDAVGRVIDKYVQDLGSY